MDRATAATFTFLCKFQDGKFEVCESSEDDLVVVDKSFHAALARLCIKKLEREHHLDQILDLFEVYRKANEDYFRLVSGYQKLLSEALELAESRATGDESLPRIASLIRRAMGGAA